MNCTINEALGWKKTLTQRHTELVQLRNENSRRGERLFGESEKIRTEPVYNIKKLDFIINNIAKEIRKLDDAIKAQNAKTLVDNYTRNDDVLGEIE